MKTFVPEALLLLLAATLALTRHPEGSHSMYYFQTLLTWPGLMETQFVMVAFVDDMRFERFNSRAQPPRREHCALWVDQQRPEYWDGRTQLTLEQSQMFRETLKEMLHVYQLSETGYHTIQNLYGCDLLSGSYSSHGQYELTFNGHDYIVLNEDLRTWTSKGKAAEMLRRKWEESDFAQAVKTYLEKECLKLLLTQLDYGKEILLRTDIPQVHVTRKIIANGKITLRCLALNFYPAEITLTWQRDGSNQTLDIELVDTRPAGDGTFQKWAAVVVPSGEEQRYTCHVHHEGLPEPLTLRWEPPQPSVPIMPIVTGLVLGAVLMGAAVTFLMWKRRSKGKRRAGSGFMSLWVYLAQAESVPCHMRAKFHPHSCSFCFVLMLTRTPV
ncbi:class I histocompatibility antigen, Gogo-A*0501 alpha chain-like [Arvicola amphibius]|uniref:class I histocompatibility antigen, Gogo-A*0501 alpha chain-like n=1 Tax=Arvicola amphibius TaxID=1047088 RepID=UPI0018E391F4|nr:class I histocompatibility antigen, Gogo-A*0501 alpha chain-like [Arvicola amphibius]